jgi:hypothetical protein
MLKVFLFYRGTFSYLFSFEHDSDSSEDDIYIQKYRSILDIIQIELCFFFKVQVISAKYLSISCHAWLDAEEPFLP